MKERIEELAYQAYENAQRILPREAIIESMTTIFNEALELAARECHRGLTAQGCAAAIRMLKVE